MMHPPDSLLEWALPCGTWFGHRVRASALFLVVPVVLGLQVWDFRLALIVGVFLACAVLIHEFALMLAIRLSGGEVRDLLVWPLGGVPRLGGSAAPVAPSAAVIAGLVSAAVSVLCLPAMMQGPFSETAGWSVLNPLSLPVTETDEGAVYSLLPLFFFANWVVFLTNLIPSPPFDGGRVLESMLVARMGTSFGRQVLARVGLAAGVGVVLSALLLESVWFCAIGALLVGYNLRESMRVQAADNFDDSFMGYDFSQGYTSLERSAEHETDPSPGIIQRWLERRRARRAIRNSEKAQKAERELDELLAKVHTYGIDSLTDSERRTLRRVSARYRGRSGS